MNDWQHLYEKAKRHSKCNFHVDNCMKVALFGKTDIAEQLNFSYNVSGSLLRCSGHSVTYHKVKLKIYLLV